MSDLFTGIDWRETIIINTIRAALSGFVLGILILIYGSDPKTAFVYMFGMVFFFWIGIFPLSYIVDLLTKMGVPVVGWLNFMWGVMMSLGDPIYFFIGRVQKWVPHSPDQSLFAMVPTLLILREDVPHVNTLGE